MRENGERERGEGELDVVLVGTFFFLVVFKSSMRNVSSGISESYVLKVLCVSLLRILKSMRLKLTSTHSVDNK